MTRLLLQWHNRPENTEQTGSKCHLHSCSPMASRLFSDFAYEVSTLLTMSFIPWIRLSHSTSVLFLAQSSKTSMEYIMKCWVTSVQKGQAFKSFLIGKCLQWMHIERCWLLFPFLFFQEPFAFFGANLQSNRKSQPPSKAPMQTGALQGQ